MARRQTCLLEHCTPGSISDELPQRWQICDEVGPGDTLLLSLIVHNV